MFVQRIIGIHGPARRAIAVNEYHARRTGTDRIVGWPTASPGGKNRILRDLNVLCGELLLRRNVTWQNREEGTMNEDKTAEGH